MPKTQHPVQISILKELLFNNGTNFASLNKSNLTNDHFTFHIKTLVGLGLIEKFQNKYFLTQEGKVYAGELDTVNLNIEVCGKASIAVTAKKIINGKKYFLVQQRLKEPFYGKYGFINGKIRFGDTSEATAIRELEEETGLTGKVINLGVCHKLRGPSPDNITLDNYFFIYLVKNPKGKLKDTDEGKNSWMTIEEIKKQKTFPGFEDILKIISEEKFHPYFEKFYKVESI